MPNPKTDWDALRVFLSIARNGTVRGAASEIGTHHSTASRRLDVLEDWLGTRLFDRTRDGYILTGEGEALRDMVSTIADQIDDAAHRIGGREKAPRGTVRMTLPLIMAERIIAPRLAKFCADYPEIDLELLTSYDFFDIDRREADIAIRLDNNPTPSLIGKRLTRYSQCAYATPDYINRTTPDATPDAARWINFSDDRSRFPRWASQTAYSAVPAWGYVPDVRAQASLAVHGVGMAFLPCLLGDASPELVRLPKQKPVPARDVWVLTHQDLRATTRVRVVMDFAEQAIRENTDLITGAL